MQRVFATLFLIASCLSHSAASVVTANETIPGSLKLPAMPSVALPPMLTQALRINPPPHPTAYPAINRLESPPGRMIGGRPSVPSPPSVAISPFRPLKPEGGGDMLKLIMIGLILFPILVAQPQSILSGMALRPLFESGQMNLILRSIVFNGVDPRQRDEAIKTMAMPAALFTTIIGFLSKLVSSR